MRLWAVDTGHIHDLTGALLRCCYCRGALFTTRRLVLLQTLLLPSDLVHFVLFRTLLLVLCQSHSCRSHCSLLAMDSPRSRSLRRLWILANIKPKQNHCQLYGSTHTFSFKRQQRQATHTVTADKARTNKEVAQEVRPRRMRLFVSGFRHRGEIDSHKFVHHLHKQNSARHEIHTREPSIQ